MNIIFIHSGPPIDGNSLEKGPLGGTETALIGVAQALAQNPENKICVFTNTENPGDYHNVSYRPLAELAAWSANHVADVFISVRQWTPLLLPVQAKLRIYFSPDAHDQPFLHRAFDVAVKIEGANCVVPLFEPNLFMPDVDAIFCVGKWQADTFVERLQFPRDKMFITGNGVFLKKFAPKNLSERAQKLIYSSTPFRGLEHILRLFPSIKALRPSTTLDVFSGMGVYGVARDEDEKTYGALYQKIKTVGAISHGSIRQAELARELCASRVFAYPNTFDETFCIAVLEAQAAGLPVVTSKKAGLCERIENGVDGFLIAGEPGEAAYDKAFITAIIRLLEDDALWARMSEASRVKAASFSYENLATNWMDYFAKMLSHKESPTLPKAHATKLEFIEVSNPSRPGGKIRFDAKALGFFLTEAKRAYGF